MASQTKVEVDHKSAMAAINNAPGLPAALERATSGVTSRANALGAGYRTAKYHDHKTGETRGDKAPIYVGDVMKGKKGPIGIVHPKNYAAMKDNHLHNTLLKSM